MQRSGRFLKKILSLNGTASGNFGQHK